MRMSCNGCRVLRKGCSDNCSIKPCLQWIKSPDSQANATVFLAKFYGRAGLMNLINSGPDHLRPAIFRSLLYEACGRIVNPIYGSVGLLWSGSWQLCQDAVEAVLKGAPIVQIESEAAETNNGPPLKAYDIRHVNKMNNDKSDGSGTDLHRVRTRYRFKRSSVNKPKVMVMEEEKGWGDINDEEGNRSTSHESSLSHQSHELARNVEGAESQRDVMEISLSSSDHELETAHDQAEDLERVVEADDHLGLEKVERAGDGEIELDLTLGLYESTAHSRTHDGVKPKELIKRSPVNGGVCRMELGLLDYSMG